VIAMTASKIAGSEQGGLRPALILSQNEFNERSGTVIVAAITS
jgi:mRNA interferase MazF